MGTDRAVTIMVDLTRNASGCLHARLLAAVVGRSGTVYKTWLRDQPEGFTGQVEQAALDPFRGYANAIRDELPDAIAVLDAFHVVRLGTQVVDVVRRRVQQATLGHRGHKDDPLYKIRGLLRHGVEHLTDDVLSWGSRNSFLSIRSEGSMLSVGSIGSIASVGSVGSILSVG